MKWFQHKVLSPQDMEWLAGTPTMEKLVQHRLIIMYDAEETQPAFQELGCEDIQNIFFMHRQNNETLEFYFYSREDLELMKEKLTVAKLGND